MVRNMPIDTPPTLGTKKRSVWDRKNKPRRAVRADIAWNDAPCIVLWDEDGNSYSYPMTPSETATFIRRAAGYLSNLLKVEL